MVTQFERDFGYDIQLAKKMVADVFKAPEQQQEAQDFLDSLRNINDPKDLREENKAYNENPL